MPETRLFQYARSASLETGFRGKQSMEEFTSIFVTLEETSKVMDNNFLI